MSKIQSLLAGRDDALDANAVFERYPWLGARKQKCVLSPDSDGLLCGLLMTSLLGWEVVGFYDGKVLALRDGIRAIDPDVAFLDIEVFRSEVRSVGHHMLLYNARRVPSNWGQFDNCLQPNLLRGYDGCHAFRLKYPLATIHFLLAILGTRYRIPMPKSGIAPLLFTDGVFQILYLYPENVLHWLNYLGINRGDSPLRSIFMQDHYTVYDTMLMMDEFFRQRDTISVPNQRGDRLRISTSSGEPTNLVAATGNVFEIEQAARERIERFIELLSRGTNWNYDCAQWSFDRLTVRRFAKSSFQGESWRVNNRNFDFFISRNPLSWAMTSAQNIEFTMEGPDWLTA